MRQTRETASAGSGTAPIRGPSLARVIIGPGDHIATLTENRRQFLEVCSVADRAGISYTTIGTHLHREPVAYIPADCGALMRIATNRFAPQLPELAPVQGGGIAFVVGNAGGEELPEDAEGEVCFENGQKFAYDNDPENTADSTNAMGWTTLGEIGRLDWEGYRYLTDRKSFVIIS